MEAAEQTVEIIQDPKAAARAERLRESLFCAVGRFACSSSVTTDDIYGEVITIQGDIEYDFMDYMEEDKKMQEMKVVLKEAWRPRKKRQERARKVWHNVTVAPKVLTTATQVLASIEPRLSGWTFLLVLGSA